MSTPPTPATKKYPTSYFFVAACIILMLAIVGFSIYYISNLGQDVLLQFEAIAETLPLPSDPAGQPVNQTITVEVNRSSLLSADYLAVVLPILLTVAGAFIVFLGMNRLKMYDERIDSTRADLLTELGTMVESRVAATQPEQVNAIKKSIANMQQGFKREVASEKDALIAFVSDKMGELDRYAQPHRDAIKNFETRYAWLAEAMRAKTYDPDIHTVYDAHQTVTKLRAVRMDGYIQSIQKIVEKVSSENLSGDADDYHNLSAELEHGYMYQESYKILKKGLANFPNNTDLLADLLENITKSSISAIRNDDSDSNIEPEGASAKQAVAQDALKQLEELGIKHWTWRCYIFASDYYRSIGDFEKSLELADSCIKNLPLQQQGYQKKAEIIRQMKPGMEGINESIAILSDVVAKGYPCPQCANTLGKLYMDLGQYEQALPILDRAVLSLAQDQPGVSTAYVFFHRANCHDKIFFSNPSQDNAQHLVDAFLDYKTALEIGGLATTTVSAINNRLELFKRYLPNSSEVS